MTLNNLSTGTGRDTIVKTQGAKVIKKILIVEDTTDINALYTHALTKVGYEVKSVTTGDEALAVTPQFVPDLILLDIMIPGQTGLEVLKKLRNDAQYKALHTQIIIITNLANDATSNEAKQEGADGYIVKAEVLPKDLVKLIQDLDKPAEG